MEQEKIGKFIAESRKRKNLTQKQLSELLSVTDKTISRWENGNYMPDLSLLKPLSEILGISLNELLSGEKIDKDNISKKSEENIIKTINLSQKKLGKNKRKMIIILSVVMIMVFSTFAIFDYIHFMPASYKEGDVSKWENIFTNNEAYDMGLHDDMPVFKNPKRAFRQARIDYALGIKEIQKQFKLLPLTKYTYKVYGTYGWQVITENREIKEQALKISQFFDIYENSFE